MPPMAPFALHRPASVAEAVARLAAEPAARPIAGGTDLVPNLRRGLGAPALLVDVTAIPGLDGIEAGPDGSVRLGANATLARLARDPLVAARLPALRDAAAAVAGPAHRSAATLGGNLCLDTRCTFYNQSAWWRAANNHCLKHGGDTCHVAPQGRRCHAAYAGDTAPVLIALDAEVEVAGPAGTRRLPVHALYVEDGAAHLALARGELVVGVHVPAQPAHARCGYRKLRARGAMDFPLAGVAARVALDGARLAGLRVALTGTNACPLLLADTGPLAGGPVDEALLGALGKLVFRQASPMRTTAVSAHWRRSVAAVTAQRLVAALAAGG